MHIESTASSPSTSIAKGSSAAGVDLPDLKVFVFGLFFVFGGITSLNDVIIPKLKGLFTLSYAQAMLVQSAFFAAYLLVSIPAASVVRKVGYMRTAVLGLSLMTIGSLLFVPASAAGSFGVFLSALFVLAAGITTVQVVANPLITLLGPSETAHSRLTFAQGFNSLGTTVFPYFGAMLILGGLSEVDASAMTQAAMQAYRSEETRVIVYAYLGLAAVLAVVTGGVWLRRNRLPPSLAEKIDMLAAFGLLRRRRFAFGSLSIFLYVGAEVAIGSLIVSFLVQADTQALSEQAAGMRVTYYWGGAMVGRFIGAYVLRLISPGKVLAATATAAIALIMLAITAKGDASGWALLAIGLCNSIMFPTIFSLASEGLGKHASDGSGIICMAIVGGAIIPPLTGHLADMMGLRLSLLLPLACYALIALFGLYARRPEVPDALV